MEGYHSIQTIQVDGNIRCAYLDNWHEEVVFNLNDICDGQVTAQGQKSGAHYILDLDDFGYVAHAEIMY